MKIGVFASGNGTNLQAVINACESGELNAEVCAVISNNSGCGAAERARNHGIPFYHISGRTHPDPQLRDAAVRDVLSRHTADTVFLAGFMKKIGPQTLHAFRGRILNTHPALLPKHGGKGMYGMNVHRAVLAAGDGESGVSIHLVDENYDTGPVIAQCRVPVLPGDTAEALCERVMERERRFVVETLKKITEGGINPAG